MGSPARVQAEGVEAVGAAFELVVEGAPGALR